jgi:exodeoxyribonuclease V gamma subunit
VLVGQLRDHIQAGWRCAAPADAPEKDAADRSGATLLEALTTTHPLQPFSRRYFAPRRDPERLFTYAHEWHALHTPSATPREPCAPQLERPVFDAPVNLTSLGRFLRRPVHTFYSQRLSTALGQDAEVLDEAEPFDVTGLKRWSLHDQAISAITLQLAAQPQSASASCLETAIGRLARAGTLPLPPFDIDWREQLTTTLADPLERYRALLAAYPQQCPTWRVALEVNGLQLEDSLSGLRADADGNGLLLTLQASELLTKKQAPKWYHLVRHWPRHLAAQLAAPTTTHLIGPGGDVTLPPLEPDAAKALLTSLMDGFAAGLSAPLPLACKTGFAWLAAEAGERQANPGRAYEGGFRASAERDEHPGYSRFWPDYETLSSDEQFAPRIDQLYRPVFDAGATAREA